MRELFKLGAGRSGLGALLRWTLGGSILIFIALEFWRPCYFLTDDNLSGTFPVLTEIGRRLKAGRSPFVSDYLFGGNYNGLRDIGYSIWHPFFLLPSLLADTGLRFWIVDLTALLFLIVTVTGFTVLAHHLREEYALPIPDGYLIFYTLSFVFSTYILTIGPSWMGFLASQSCLPWLTLGILEKRVLRATLLVAFFTVHGMLCAYPGLILSGGLCLSLLALGVAAYRRSIQPVFVWLAGNMIALLVLTPLLLSVLDGFSHSRRILGMSLDALSLYSIPPAMCISSFFIGNWSEPITRAMGDSSLHSLGFPYLPTILACPAAWCLVSALFGGGRWRYLDKLCVGLCCLLLWSIIRPTGLALIMHALPILRSLRWPFREGLLLLFFVHLFLILRFPQGPRRWQWSVTVFSFLVFILPLPFIRVPTLNPLALDRRLLFSGQADAFWAAVKSNLKPTDEIATVIDWDDWQRHSGSIPYTLLGTASFPAYFQVRCISGYSPTSPADQVPLKTIPYYWFGAFRPQQVGAILAEKPDLKLIRVESTDPLKIVMSTGNGPAVEVYPDLPK